MRRLFHPLKRFFLKLKLAQKISLLVIFIVLLATSVCAAVSGRWYIARMLENLEQNALNVVRITAMSPTVVDGLERGVDDGSIQRFVEAEQQSLDQIDIMVVADHNAVRYGHTKSDRVGELFSAQDHVDALEKGETYVTIGPGTLGDSLRAFTPVYSRDGSRITGFVMSGTLLDSIAQAERTIFLMALGFLLLGCTVGVVCAVFLSRYIKRSLLSYEPEDIAMLYLENQGILSTVHEGILSIDAAGTITTVNKAAHELLGAEGDCAGQNIAEVFPLSKLPEVLETRQPLLNVPYALGDKLVVSNNLPIIDDKGRLKGGVCTFRDQTEVNRLAGEITGVKKVVDALRATTHEFKNKLHVILGLIETGRTAQAKAYIGSINEALQATVNEILAAVREPNLSALLIGKSQRFQELGILWELEEGTQFTNALKFDVNALIVIVGNLLDNAADALDAAEQSEKRIGLYLNDQQGALLLRVTDNGPGILHPERIFERGYTTKAESRGYGLALVREQVEKYQGRIDLKTGPGAGACFSIRLERQGRPTTEEQGRGPA